MPKEQIINYSTKLKDPRWQKKRLEILQRDNWSCQRCGDNKSTLHVHHRRYIPDRDPWDYPDDILVTLCEDCHQNESETMGNMCEDLISMIRDKFFSDEIYILADAFRTMEINKGSHFVIADAIRWVLTNPDILREITKRYLQVWEEETHQDK